MDSNFTIFIRSKLTELIATTDFSGNLITKLFQENVLSNEERQIIQASQLTQIDRATEFFVKILPTKTWRDVQITIDVLKNNLHDVAANILSDALQDDPLTIMEVDEKENRVFLRSENLERILRTVGERKFVIVSINGEMRRGKSFTMSCFLQYLYSGFSVDWLEQMKNGSNNAFKWRSGNKRETQGISIWSKPFFVRDSDGNQVAILLLDYQGEFDKDTTLNQNSLLFSISCLLSSVLIYNVLGPVSENSLSPLAFFLKTACEADSLRYQNIPRDKKVFQDFILLNRDFSDPDFQFGYYNQYSCPENQKYNLFLEVFHPQTASEDAKSIRRHILSCFSSHGVFALPFPGTGIFSDDITSLDTAFVEQTTNLMNRLFSPGSLTVKQVNGIPISAVDYIPYFSSLADLINENKLPNVQSFFSSVLQNQFVKITKLIVDTFDEQMKTFTDQHAEGMPEAELAEEAQKRFHEAIEYFKNYKIFCSYDEKNKQLALLFENLTKNFKIIVQNNNLKIKAKKQPFLSRRTVKIAIYVSVVGMVLTLCVIGAQIWLSVEQGN